MGPDAIAGAMSESWAHRLRQTLRFADLDPLGHVNNVAIFELFECGRVAFLSERGLSVASAEPLVVLAHIGVDFRAELHWPGEVTVATRVARIGRSSFTLAQALYDGERLAATSEAVCVALDRAAGRATPLPEWLREALASG